MLRLNLMKLSILNAYAPTECTLSEATKATFYTDLNKAKAELDLKPKFKIVTLGDFNATISSHSKESGAWDEILASINSYRVTTNGNGEKLLGWCLKHKMMIMNSKYWTKRIHRATWQHAATGKWKRIDYICISRWVAKYVKS